MRDWILRQAQRCLVGREEVLARRWQLKLSDVSAKDRRGFERALLISPGPGRVVLATVQDRRGEWKWLGLSTKRLLGHHASIAGATGSGKSSLVIGVLAQLLVDGGVPIILADFKGETADVVLEQLVPYLIDRGCGEALLKNLRVVRVFDADYTALLNVTLPEAAVPKEAQAFGVAAAVEQALAEPLGGRMHHVLVRCVTLCIERRWPLIRVSEWLAHPASFVRAAQQSDDAAMREYARGGFQQENKESLRALGARLNALFLWPGAREALCAPGSISLSDALTEPGLTVISTGSPPAGAERLARFFGALLFGKVVRAILSRQVVESTPQALLVAEELPEVLGPEEARQVGRLLAISRFKRAAVWMTGQSHRQLSAVDPALLAALRANVGLQVQFRSSPEDAVAFAHLLPQEGEGETARRALINAMTRLPQRHCYVAVRDLGLPAQLVVAPRIEFDRFRAAGDALPRDIRLQIRQGIAAVRREDLRYVDTPIEAPKVSEVPARPAPTEDGPFPALG